MRAIDMDQVPLRPWERRDDESEAQYRAFLCWRDQNGDRTLLRTYRAYIDNRHALKVPDSFRRWCGEYDWDKRTLEWDRYAQARMDEAHLTAREEVASKRGTTLADLESRQVELAYETSGFLQELLGDENFQKSIVPQQVAPLMRAINETFKTLATFRNLRDESGAKTTAAPPLTEEKIRILFEDFEMPEDLAEDLEEEPDSERED